MSTSKTPEEPKIETVLEALERAPETKALHQARMKWAVIDHWLPENATIEQRLARAMAEPKKMIWHAIDLETRLADTQAKLEEARAAIEGAPHEEDCAFIRDQLDVQMLGLKCTCWKSRALSTLTQPESGEP